MSAFPCFLEMVTFMPHTVANQSWSVVPPTPALSPRPQGATCSLRMKKPPHSPSNRRFPVRRGWISLDATPVSGWPVRVRLPSSPSPYKLPSGRRARLAGQDHADPRLPRSGSLSGSSNSRLLLGCSCSALRVTFRCSYYGLC